MTPFLIEVVAGICIAFVLIRVCLFRAPRRPRRQEAVNAELARIYQQARRSLAVPCERVHPAGAECAVCNPVVVDGFSSSPDYGLERLAVIYAEDAR